MGNYRDKWFKNNPPVFGKYRCVRCGGWFPKEEIDIDHIIPQSKGGTDDLINLQAMCKHCNRSKQASTQDTAPDFIKNTAKVGVQTLAKHVLGSNKKRKR